MNPSPATGEERVALKLSTREWLVVALLVTTLAAVAPWIPIRSRSPVVDRDYRIPYALSSRYEIYRRFAALSAAQFPTLVVGDSVVWGQCARKDDTLSHHLNALTKQPRFANAGLDGMHPIALAELLEHHAPAIKDKDVILQLDPMWLMVAPEDAQLPGLRSALFNRPGLVPRLAADLSSSFKARIGLAGTRLLRRSPLADWAERFSDSRVDFLAWSLDHPYESPLKAISSALPASEDSHTLRLIPWSGKENAKLDYGWPVLDEDRQWKGFERALSLLELRGNRVLVLVGPMNESMMSGEMKRGYQALKESIRRKLGDRAIDSFIARPLSSEQFTDICHPLGAGYEELARELLKSESAWLLGTGRPR